MKKSAIGETKSPQHLTTPPKHTNPSLFDRIHKRFAALGGVDLQLPPRELSRDPPHFDETSAPN